MIARRSATRPSTSRSMSAVRRAMGAARATSRSSKRRRNAALSIPASAAASRRRRHRKVVVRRGWRHRRARHLPAERRARVCAPCHSRRADLGGARAGYHDRYRLAVLDEARYFDDGQIETRSTSMARSCRAKCTRRAWFAAIATTGTARISERRATRCAHAATKSICSTDHNTTFTSPDRPAVVARTAICRSAPTC